MRHRINEFRQKGWTEEEIGKTVQIFDRIKKHKEDNKTFLELIIFWVVLLVGLVGNLIVSLAFIPIMLVLSGFYLYVIIFIIAIAFGFLFEILVRDIENLEAHHHRFIQFLIPVFAIVNFIIIVYVTNRVADDLKIVNRHNPFIVGITYAMAFLLPYFYYHINHKTLQ